MPPRKTRTSPLLAPPQENQNKCVQVASFNFGGAHPKFKSSEEEQKAYRRQLPHEIHGLMEGRHVLGITGLNTSWYEWLTKDFEGDGYVPSFAAGKGDYQIIHDGVSAAIMYDTRRVQLVSKTDPEYSRRMIFPRMNWLNFRELPSRQSSIGGE